MRSPPPHVFQITAVTELSLTANQPVAAMRARKLAWSTVEEDGTVVHAQDAAEDVPVPVTVDAPVVVLNPLQVRVRCALCTVACSVPHASAPLCAQ